LNQDWDWWISNGAKAIELLKPYKNVTVLYGHIHQENHHATGHLHHHSVKGIMCHLPVSGSVPKKAPIQCDDRDQYKGLGF